MGMWVLSMHPKACTIPYFGSNSDTFSCISSVAEGIVMYLEAGLLVTAVKPLVQFLKLCSGELQT